MRRLAFIGAIALAIAACGKDATAPASTTDDSVILSLEGSVLGLTGSADGAVGVAGNTPDLPADLALTADQRAQITALVDAFQQSVHADVEGLRAVERRAIEARHAGKSADEVNAIRAEGAAIRLRIEAAAQRLRTDIQAVLTPAQRDWVRAHGGGDGTCDGRQQLTPEQQAQIQALIAAFQAEHAADIQAIQKAMADARAAKSAGKTEAEVRAILETARAAQERLQAAHAALQERIRAILSTTQRGTGCFAGG